MYLTERKPLRGRKYRGGIICAASVINDTTTLQYQCLVSQKRKKGKLNSPTFRATAHFTCHAMFYQWLF